MQEFDLFGFPAYAIRPLWIIWTYAGLFLLIGIWLAYWPPKPNWWGGLRVSWTYADREIWDKGNRATGWTMIVSGALLLIWVPAGFAAVIILPISMVPYAWHLIRSSMARRGFGARASAGRTIGPWRSAGIAGTRLS